jgi:hypothetical protein
MGQKKCGITLNNQTRINPPSSDTLIYSPSGMFTIHYDTAGVDAPDLVDLNQNGIPDYVDSVAITIDYVRIQICDEMGYKAVPANNEPAYPIYISNRGSGYYGVNWGSGNSEEAPNGWVEIDNNYSNGFYTSGIKAMQVTVAHEFFHAIQRKYKEPAIISGVSTVFFHEFSSTWIEDIIYPDHNDYTYWVDDFYNSPSKIFEETNGYSVASFGYYLNTVVEELDENELNESIIIQSIWEDLENNNVNPKILLDNELHSNYGISFMDTWTDFISRNYFNGIDNQFYYHSDQNLMPIIGGVNPIIMYSNYSENIILFDDEISLSAVKTGIPGILQLNHNGQIPSGKIVIIGDNNQIRIPDITQLIPMQANDILRTIYFHDNYSNVNIDYELFQAPSQPYGLIASEDEGQLILNWNNSINAGEDLFYNIYRNDFLIQTVDTNYFTDIDAELLIEYEYQIEAENEYGKSNKSSSITMILWYDNPQIKVNKIISIYPNPNKKKVNKFYLIIDSMKNYQSPYIQLFNVRGQIVNQFNLFPFVKGRQRINLLGLVPSHSHSGIYIFNFCFDEMNCIQKSITWLK